MYINYPKYNYNYQLDGIYFNLIADQKQTKGSSVHFFSNKKTKRYPL